MENKVLLNKQNIILYWNNKPLGGIIDFDVKSESTAVNIYEMLKSEPWVCISGRKKYTVTIKQYSEKFQLLSNDGGCLTFDFNGNSMSVSGCNVESFNTALDSNGKLVTTTVITGEGMVD